MGGIRKFVLKREKMSESRFRWSVVVGVTIDALVMVAAFAASFAMRFEFREPMWGWKGAWLSFLTVWSVQAAMLLFFDCGRRWRLRARDWPRFMGAFVASVVMLTVLRIVLPAPSQLYIRPPYSITLINGVLAAVGLLGVRWLWTLYVNARTLEARLLTRREMPPVDKKRHDLLTEATKSLYEECKARMDAVLLEEKKIFVELLAEDPESLQETVDQINKKHSDAVSDIQELRDKKLDEIEEAYAKYQEDHPQTDAEDGDLDVTHSMHLGDDDE